MELLVCIAIIALLAVLLIPTLRGISEAGQKSKCLSNLRQLGVALQNYAAENDQYGPWDARDLGNTSPASLRAGQSLILFGQLMPYLGIETTPYLHGNSVIPEVFVCPATPRSMIGAVMEPVGPWGVQYARYWMNLQVSSNPGKATKLINLPQRTISMVDCCNWWAEPDANVENHRGQGMNVIRLDGSAGWIAKKETKGIVGPFDFDGLSGLP